MPSSPYVKPFDGKYLPINLLYRVNLDSPCIIYPLNAAGGNILKQLEQLYEVSNPGALFVEMITYD